MASQQEEAPGLPGDQITSVADHSTAAATNAAATDAAATDATTTAVAGTDGLAEANLADGLATLAVAEDNHTTNNPTAATSQYQEGEEEVMWHRIKAYLKNPVGPKPSITCSICCEPLFIHGITPRPAEDEVEQLKTTVMVCGHMFHHGCFDPLIRPGFRGNCPYCNQSLIFSCYCGKYYNFAPTEPGDDPDDLTRVLLTWPEGAERVDRCPDCKAARRNYYWSRLPEEERTFHGIVFVDSDVENESEEEDDEDESDENEGEEEEGEQEGH